MYVGIVGAGAAGAAAAFALDDHATVTLLERTDAVGGRSATRTRAGPDGAPAYRYDYGANYLKDDDERVTDLVRSRLGDGLVEATGDVYTFDAAGEVSPGRDADDHKWSYRTGVATLARRLLDATDARVRHGVAARRLRRRDGRWAVVDDEGDSWGPFDALVVTPPAPRSARLLRAGDPGERRTALADAADAVPYRSVYTAVLGYGFRVERPYYGLVNVDKAHEVGWISREECKPGHVPAGETVLVVQANDGWSRDNEDADPDAAAGALADHTAAVVGDDRLAAPSWTDTAFWRHALPEAGVAPDPVADAAAAGLHVAGDWVAGEARLHAAVRSGLETGETVVAAQPS